MQSSKISLTTAILMNINLMVGAGIFINPSLMAQQAGFLSYLGWPLIGIIFLPVVLNIAEVTKLFPGAGSFYTYATEINKTAGFASGWMYFLGYVAIGSTQTLALRVVLSEQLQWEALDAHPILFYALFFLLMCSLNLFNLAIVGRIQKVMTVFKLLPILMVCIIFPFYMNGSLPSNGPETVSSLGLTIPLAVFGFWGFEGCASFSHRIAGDNGVAGRAILLGFLSTLSIYVLFHFGLLHIMGAGALAADGVPAFVEYLGITVPVIDWTVRIVLSLAFVSAFASAIYGGLTANSFLLHALAEDDLLFASSYIKRLNKHYQPVYAVFAAGTLAFLFTSIVGNVRLLISMSNFGVLGAFYLTLWVLLRRGIRAKRWGKVSMTMLALLSTTILVYYSYVAIGSIVYTLPFVITAVAGIVMFKLRHGTKTILEN